MDLRTRLLRAGLHQGPMTTTTPSSSRRYPLLEELVGGHWVVHRGARCLVRDQSFPLDYRHGEHLLGDFLRLPPDIWAPFLGDHTAHMFNLAQGVFIDIETTGLSQGAGTYAFLVGAGFCEGDHWLIRQYFMPDYGDEEALLHLLSCDLCERQGIISFNGRCFDWPILTMRYLLSRREPPEIARAHLDLLYVARRLWSRMLSSCALSNLETSLLCLERTEEDVPGYLIPQIYQDYVRWGDTRPLAGVLYHNRMDILGMVALACRAGRILRAPFPAHEDPFCDYLSLGIMYQRANRIEEALEAYRLAGLTRADAHRTALAAKHLSFLLKSLARHDEAMEIWRSRLGGDELYPYVELAKQYEHRLRDYAAAALVIQEAISWAMAQDSSSAVSSSQNLLGDLHHRLSRIQRRLQRQKDLELASSAPSLGE